MLYNRGMDGLEFYEREVRPWGNFERFTLNQQTTVKIVTVNPGESISLQTHEHRDEFWRVLSGSGKVVIDGIEHDAKTGEQFFGKRGNKHRVEGGPSGMQILEIAFGEFDETDITRLEDRYGRAPQA